MPYSEILTETRDRVALITLNRPKALNALSSTLIRELGEAVGEFDSDPSIGAIIITGSGKAFAAGADISEMHSKSYMDMYRENFLGDGTDLLSRCRKPVIAAVNGYALGGGCEIAMMCDFIIAADSARFGQPEINIGVIPGLGGTQRLTRIVGKSKAMEMCLTGRMMDAQEAENLGLVARIVAADQLLEETMNTASEIASKSLPAVMLCKEAVNQAYESSLAKGLLFERRQFYSLFASEDQKEGMSAFLEKREPEWKHR